ncbi:MAG: tetratricopeptide repeat protein [Sphingomonadales bacterium]|nr:tetratricopeptide repeat protein [Sphingomonadales bacterium]
MTALDLYMEGRFNEAIDAYRLELAENPGDIGSIDGLASSLRGTGDFASAIPLMEQVHEHQKRNPDHPGQHLNLAVAYWCLDDRARAIELARGLCAAILNGSVSMAPDHAGGATFGLVLHYMAVTAGDEINRDYTLRYLKKLNVKYDKRPTLFRYPVATVKQVLGEVSFEDALASATGERDLASAHRAANGNRSTMLALGQVLFHDGAIFRANGDEANCKARMQEVFDLGYQTESVCWYLARHEVGG